MERHRAKKIESGIYEYRGYQIERNDWVNNGYWGKWEANFGRIVGCTMKECKDKIDKKLDNK